MSDLIEGLYPKEKHENAPDFVMCKLSINVDQFGKWLDAWRAANPGEEWLRVDMLTSRAGKGYAKVDTWKPSTDKPATSASSYRKESAAAESFDDLDVPF